MHGYRYNDYSGDNDTRESVTGYIVIINGVVIAWHWISQKIVALSIIESEYSETTEICCKILFSHAFLLLTGVVFWTPHYC